MPAHQTLQAHYSQAVEALRRSARAALDTLGCRLARNRRGSCQRVLTKIADLLQGANLAGLQAHAGGPAVLSLPRAFVDLFRASWVGCTVSRPRKSLTNWQFAFGWAV